MSPETFLAHDARLERVATRAVVEAAPDIMHVNHLVGVSPRLLQVARRLRVPTLVTVHDYYFACGMLHLRKRTGNLCSGPDGGRECAATCFAGDPLPERWRTRTEYFECLLGYVDHVTCPSPHVAAYFERHAPGAAPIDVLPLGVAVGGLAERDSNGGGELRLAYLGIVTAQKGVETIIEAVRIAQLPRARLIVLGRDQDGYAHRLRALASRVPRLRLEIVGEYEPEDVPRLLYGVDVVVVPSRLPEVFPLAPREALAAGVPVIVGRLGGLPDVVDEGSNGLTFDSARPEELASILRRLVDDPQALERLRRGARETHVLTAPEHLQLLRQRYARLVEGSSREWDRKEAEARQLDTLYSELVRAGFGGDR